MKPFRLFLVGAMRSGTTLLRHLLGNHSRLYIPNESHFVPYLFRSFESTGRFPVEWLFEEGATIRHYPSPTEYESHPPETAAQHFGELLRFVPWIYQLSRSDLESYIAEPSRTYPEIVDWVFQKAMASDPSVVQPERKTFYGDKTPHYVREIPTLRRLYPEALIVNIVRDGRAVACSKSMNRQLVLPRSDRATRLREEVETLCPGLKIEIVTLCYRDNSWLETKYPWLLGLPPVLEPSVRESLAELIPELRKAWEGYTVEVEVKPRHIRHQAQVWMGDVEFGKQADLTIRYRDLVTDPKRQLQRVCSRLGIEVEEQMTEYYRNQDLCLIYGDSFGSFPSNRDIMGPTQAENIDKWRRLLPASAISSFESVAGRVLRQWD